MQRFYLSIPPVRAGISVASLCTGSWDLYFLAPASGWCERRKTKCSKRVIAIGAYAKQTYVN